MIGLKWLRQLGVRFRKWLARKKLPEADLMGDFRPGSFGPNPMKGPVVPPIEAEKLTSPPEPPGAPPEPTPTEPPPTPHPEPTTVSLAAKRPPRARLSELEKNRRRYDKFLAIAVAETATGRSARPSHPILDVDKEPEEPPPPDPTEADPLGTWVLTQKTDKGDKVRIAESELGGEYNFRDTILDQLDRYWVYIKRMKKRDRDSYHQYRQVGATLLPYAALSMDRLQQQFTGTFPTNHNDPHSVPVLPPVFVKNLPSFGCFAYGTDPVTEAFEGVPLDEPHQGGTQRWIPRFVYFTKYAKAPKGCQACPGSTLYKVTVYWDRLGDKVAEKKCLRGGGVPQDFAVAVMKDGRVKALKMYIPADMMIRSKRKRPDSGLRRDWVHRRAWGIPDLFATEKGETEAHRLEDVFANCAHWHETNQYSMFRVSVKKGELTATFGVNALRAAYFFADRDLHIGETGAKKRIFHMVRPHVRSDGAVVKAHFRGEKQFHWAGYDVSITVPGRDHVEIASYNAGSYAEEDSPEGVKMVTSKKLGRFLAEIVEGKDPRHLLRET